MKNRPEDWVKLRSNGQKLTAAEVELIHKATRAGRTAIDIAREVGCSVRAVNKHRAVLRESRHRAGARVAQPAAPVRLGTLPERHYRSDFEPS